MTAPSKDPDSEEFKSRRRELSEAFERVLSRLEGKIDDLQRSFNQMSITVALLEQAEEIRERTGDKKTTWGSAIIASLSGALIVVVWEIIRLVLNK